MKGLSRAAAGLAAFVMAITGAADALARPDDVIGRWATPSRHGVVEITPCGAGVCGRLVVSDAIRANPDARDTKNDVAVLRNRQIKGLLLLDGFHRSDNGWTGGTIYNPEDGGTYHATITPSGPGTLVLKGCVIWPLCKGQTWRRLP